MRSAAATSPATTASVAISSAAVARGSLVSAISRAATASHSAVATTIPRRRSHGSCAIAGRSASASAIGAAKLKMTWPRRKFCAMYALSPSGST